MLGIAHLGVCMLARVDGTSPVEYLPEEPKREAVRRLGRSLLLRPPGSWEDVLALAAEELQHRLFVIGRRELVINKRSAGRPKDLVDVLTLEEAGSASTKPTTKARPRKK